jgi:intracellular septation protein
MKNFLETAKLLLLDLASTLLFLALFLLTHNIFLSVGLGMGVGLSQIVIQLARRKPIYTMEWLSLFVVVAAGAATLLTNDPRFVLFNPSIFYVVVGIVMLKAGWMNRYLPAIARAVTSDVAVIVGFVWAGLMFFSAGVNAFVAVAWSVPMWAMIMPIFGIVSKVTVFLAGFTAIRLTTVRRVRAMPAIEREALLSSTGWANQTSTLAKSA